MDHPFRSAAVGGFNRQDVLDYLEKTAAENAQKQQELEKQLEQQKQELEQLRSQVESTVSHAADELSKAGRCLDQLNQMLGEQEVALEAVSQEYLDSDPEKVPAPVPLEEA